MKKFSCNSKITLSSAKFQLGWCSELSPTNNPSNTAFDGIHNQSPAHNLTGYTNNCLPNNYHSNTGFDRIHNQRPAHHLTGYITNCLPVITPAAHHLTRHTTKVQHTIWHNTQPTVYRVITPAAHHLTGHTTNFLPRNNPSSTLFDRTHNQMSTQ